MTILLLIVAILGWVLAALCFAGIVFLSVALAAQEAKFSEQIISLKRAEERANLMRSRGKFNN